jgi:hypothetical protein
MEKKTATTVKELLLSQWIDALSLDDDDRILKGIESLKGRSIDDAKQKFYHLLSQYQVEMEKVKEKVKVQFTEAMRIDGIYGSAVEPKFEGNEIWRNEKEKLDNSYKMKLEEIKEQLKVL